MFRFVMLCLTACIMQAGLARDALAHEPRSDGSCPLPWIARDSQGFCWTMSWIKSQHDDDYARLRAAGLAPPMPSTLAAPRPPPRVNPMTVPIYIPEHALSALGESSLRDCLQRAEYGLTTEQTCQKDYAAAKEAAGVVGGFGRALTALDPPLALVTDPKGSLCDKVIELSTHHLLGSDTLERASKAYGLFDTIRKAFKPSPTEREKSFWEEVREACHWTW